MQFQTNRCIQCGYPVQPTNLKSNLGLSENGCFDATGFWACSDDCVIKLLHNFIDNKEYSPLNDYVFQYDTSSSENRSDLRLDLAPPSVAREITRIRNKYLDDWEEYPMLLVSDYKGVLTQAKREMAAVVVNWQQEKTRELGEAAKRLRLRLLAEWHALQLKLDEEKERQWEKENAEMDRMQEKMEREYEQLEREMARDAIQRQRDQERDAERRIRDEERQKREEEKRAKEEAERAAQEAEEQKWKPQDFDI